MNSKILLSVSASAIFATVANVAAADVNQWGSDVDAALAQAKKENKTVLVHFHGSEWCMDSIVLRNDVLLKDDFTKFLQENRIIPVMVDRPFDKKSNPTMWEKFQHIHDRYGVAIYPTVLLITPENLVVGGFAASNVRDVAGAEGYISLALSNENRARILLDAAAKEQGYEKAKLLYEAMQSVPRENMRDYNLPMLAQIKELDAEDKLGLRAKAREDERINAILQKLNDDIKTVGQDRAKAVELLDAAIAQDLPNHLKSELIGSKVRIMLDMAETLDDIAKIKQILLDMSELVPEEKENTLKMIDSMFADPADLLKRLIDARSKDIIKPSQQPAFMKQDKK